MATIIDRISSLWQRQQPSQTDTTETERLSLLGFDSARYRAVQDILRYVELDGTRQGHYKDFDWMDEHIEEVGAALDAYASVCLAGQDLSGSGFSVTVKDNERVQQFLDELIERLDLETRSWWYARNLAKYGDVFEELVYSASGELVKLKSLPPKTINYIPPQKGKPDIVYEQTDPTSGQRLAVFRDVEMVHGKIGFDQFGFRYSKIVRARRIAKVLQLMEQGLMITRLVHGSARLKWKVDVSHINDPVEQLKYAQSFVQSQKKRITVNEEGKRVVSADTFVPDENLVVPVTPGSLNDVEALNMGGNVGETKDVEYFTHKMSTALGVPRSYMGWEVDVSTRATFTKVDAIFFRNVRMLQRFLGKMLSDIFRRAVVVAKVATPDISWEIEFPPVGTSDEVVQWEIMKTKAMIAALLVEKLMLDPKAVAKWIFSFDDEELANLFGEQSLAGLVRDEALVDRVFEDPRFRMFLKSYESLIGRPVEPVVVEGAIDDEDF